MGEFRMPALGADMEAGTLVEWCVKQGDTVRRGDVVAVVETAKGRIDVEIFDAGTVSQLLVGPGTTVPVGTPLALLGEGVVPPAPTPAPTVAAPAEVVAPAPAEPVAAPILEIAPAAAPRVPAAPPVQVVAPVTISPPVPIVAPALAPAVAAVTAAPAPAAPAMPAVMTGTSPVTAAPIAPAHVRISPLARRRAGDLAVDLSQVQGSGPAGAITAEDVEHYAAARIAAPALAAAAVTAAGAVPAEPPPALPAATAPPAIAVIPAAGAAVAGASPLQAAAQTAAEKQAAARLAMRRAIAAAMSRSKREIPHYYLATDIDMRAALAWLEAENLKRPLASRVLPAVLLLKATALAIRDVPEMNGFFVDGEFRPSRDVHVGVAISLRQGGLVAPAIHNTDTLGLDALMAALRDLVARTRAGQLRSSEMTDPTITVSNMGDQGVASVFGIIYPPQVALVGFGTVTDRPWAVNGLLGVRPILTATLSADHRVSDGHRGGRFLAAINRLLQEPEKLQ